MLIQELTRQASLDLLARANLGRIACAHEGQPYVVPFNFAYDNYYLYSFSTVGQKIRWMRANPIVCVETEELISSQEWVSILVFGLYEELPDTPAYKQAREFAHNLLQKRIMWWEPGCAKTILNGRERPLVPVFYRISVEQISGHRASPEPEALLDTRPSRTGSGENGTLQRIMRHVRGRHWLFGGPAGRPPAGKAQAGKGSKEGSMEGLPGAY